MKHPHIRQPAIISVCSLRSQPQNPNKLLTPPTLSQEKYENTRGIKLAAYKACSSIQEILLISQFAPHVEVYRRGEDATIWNCSSYGPSSMVELTSVDIYLSMDEIYKGINFDEPFVEK